MGERGPQPGEGGRPTQDRYVCKTRYRTTTGHTKTKYSSDVGDARVNAQTLNTTGQLLFFGIYKLDQQIRLLS